ncbi:Palmitoyltransferase zdhhc15 [Perkinsus chesapeaki]|uniref:Palmitoyltransferase n=1 Tax=Perkinsus chesapeaki TaxID=330153 RepID=A0A7J6MWV8_PERCH|nr:Palmitoyltransferase zdhhc15 [Perkinsus chesapeaki]
MPVFEPPSESSSSGYGTQGSRRPSQHQQSILYRTLKKIKRFLKSAYKILLTCLAATGDALDAALEYLGILMVELVKAVAWPFKWICPTPEILLTFKDRPLAMVLPILFVCNIIMLLYIVHIPIKLVIDRLPPFIPTGYGLVLQGEFYALFGVVTDPGKIPEGGLWSSSPGGPSPPNMYERKAKDGSVRYCNKEHKFKPDRAHFCSPMGRNVLKMDHYCPWLANSVGFYNHKYFYLFLLYVVLACNTVTCQILHALAHLASTGAYASQPGQLLFLLEGLSISGLLSVIVTPFFAFHTWLISKNVTTVEYCEKRRDIGGESGSISKNIVSRMPERSPYDMGIIKNWQSVMGKNVITWFIPTRPRGLGKGLTFPINKEAREILEKDLGISVAIRGGDLESGGSSQGSGRVQQATLMDSEEDDTDAEMKRALERRQRQLQETVSEPEAPPSPSSVLHQHAASGKGCCAGKGGETLVEYGLAKSNEFADFISGLYIGAWKILSEPSKPKRTKTRRRGSSDERRSPIQPRSPPSSPGLVETGSPINVGEPDAAA